MLPYPQLSGFSAYRLQTSALTVILYTFVTQTHPPISELSIVMALGWWSLTQTGKSFSARNGSPTRWGDCFLGLFLQKSGETAYPVLTKGLSEAEPRHGHAGLHPLGVPNQLPISLCPKDIAGSDITRWNFYRRLHQWSFTTHACYPDSSSFSNQYAVYRLRGRSLNLPPVQND